jgi:hypothetical protein
MGRFGRLASSLTLALFLMDAAHANAEEPGATVPRPGAPKTAAKPPANDPRKGPRLEYTRGPAQCLSEQSFRDEVAIILDSVDHFDDQARAVARVKFEKIPGGYRGTLVHTKADGKQQTPTIKTYYNCEILGRWVAGTASGLIPDAPKESPAPSVTAMPSAAPSAAPSSVPSAVPSSRPSAVPSSAPSSTHAAIARAPAPEDNLVIERVARWCTPASDFRSVLRTATCVATALAIASGAVAIGLEADRAKIRGRLADDGCNAIPQSDAARCAALHERLIQRNVLMGITLGASIASAATAGALGLRFLLDRRHPGPSIAPAISSEGGGFIVTGAF